MSKRKANPRVETTVSEETASLIGQVHAALRRRDASRTMRQTLRVIIAEGLAALSRKEKKR